jgi:hypothetical protein
MPKRTSPHDPHRQPPRVPDPDDLAFLDDTDLDDADHADDAGPDASVVDVELDLVPGDPPVPITTWRTPAGDGGMSLRLAQRILVAYSRRGQAVHDATADPMFAQATESLGRRVAAAGGRGDPPEPAVLVVCGWPPQRSELDPAIALGALRRRLVDGGMLVVFGAPGGGFDLGTVVRAATAARLIYLQHVVAVHAPTRGERIAPHPTTTGRDGPRHQPVHTDLLAFTPAGVRHG